MKDTSKLLIFVITFLTLAASAHAQSPREELQQMVEQLQKTPNDNVLREKIIKLARTLKPAPALPDTAVTFEGRAQFAFRNAKSEDDYLAAAREYEKAVVAAPWVPGYYADLCTIYEKAGKFGDAKTHCGFYLIGLTDPAQMTDVKRRIAGLEYGIEKLEAAKRRATEEANSPQAREAALLSNVEGARFAHRVNLGGVGSYDAVFQIKNRMLHTTLKIYTNNTSGTFYGKNRPGEYSFDPVPYITGEFKHTSDQRRIFTIRPDGQALIGRYPDTPELSPFSVMIEK